MTKTYTLEDYEALAYEFAIRNPKVIELLQSSLNDKKTINDKTAEELLEYGIDTLVEYTDDEGNLCTKYSLEELYLDYPHLGDDLKKIQISHNGKRYKIEKYRELFPDAMEEEWKGNKRIVQPESYNKYFKKESDIDSWNRIDAIYFDVCMNEGSKREGVKRDELKNGDAFNYYDEKHFNQKGTTDISNKYHSTDIKTIKKYIKFIEEWVTPEKYLKLIPQKQSKFMKINITEKNTDRYY